MSAAASARADLSAGDGIGAGTPGDGALAVGSALGVVAETPVTTSRTVATTQARVRTLDRRSGR